MKTPSDYSDNSPIEIAASEWIAKMDRGLSADEESVYKEWLAENSAHWEAISKYQQDWENYDRLAGIHLSDHSKIDPDLLTPDTNQGLRRYKITKLLWISSIPIAALLVIGIFFPFYNRTENATFEIQPATELLARIEKKILEDGTILEVNRGAELKVAYDESTRRVILKKGEVFFNVAKDYQRPFVVNVSGVDVEAIGTMFSIRLFEEEVDVIVTEGIVNVKPNGSTSGYDNNGDNYLKIGQRARVNLMHDTLSVMIMSIDQSEITKVHNWQPRLLQFDEILLRDIIAEFNQCNPIQVTLSDPSLENINLSCSFWSDNVEGFVRLMESSFNMKAEWDGNRNIVLRKIPD